MKEDAEMKVKQCFFAGHRDAPSDIFPQLLESVYQSVQNQRIQEFIVGNHGNFDYLAAQAVLKVKEKYPAIKLFLLLPYYSANINQILPQGFDGTYYPPDMEKVPQRFAIVTANRYVAAHSDYLIAYVWQVGSNSAKLVEYAKRKGITVDNIAAEEYKNH